ncbi:hypothetical protein FH972_022549 [Carpinus fangiana]|uniref:Uncharacterized protein n=1 Tax=Carpinus fangiana TaxID=176857 RepID=A0A5N6KUT9_9ROSI|nr:hypothetical protein FH972_022549 [Carpinus fangiana]
MAWDPIIMSGVTATSHGRMILIDLCSIGPLAWFANSQHTSKFMVTTCKAACCRYDVRRGAAAMCLRDSPRFGYFPQRRFIASIRRAKNCCLCGLKALAMNTKGQGCSAFFDHE